MSYQIRHCLVLTLAVASDGKPLAICSDGSPQMGHEDVAILTLQPVKDVEEAKEWFEAVKLVRPWETRQ